MPDPIALTSTPRTIPAGTPVSSIGLVDVEFQFSTGTVSVRRSLDNVTYFDWPIYDKTKQDVPAGAQATVPGIYGTDGGGYLLFSADVVARAEV